MKKLRNQLLVRLSKSIVSLGYGFLVKVYQKAMQLELLQRGLQSELEYPIKIHFKGVTIGDYYADLFVERKVIVELKVAKVYSPRDKAQLLNELKATGTEVGLLINFGSNQSASFRVDPRLNVDTVKSP